MQTRAASLLPRAVLALALTVIYYALVLAILVGLGALATFFYRAGHGFDLRALFWGTVFAALALVVALSLLPPRRSKTVAGIALREEESPALFREIRRIAQDMRQPMPTHVHLAAFCNAAVTQEGGFLGFGGSRTVVVGYPLFAALDEGALLGVIAHEFGHFHGGDVALGGMIGATRASIGRTITNIDALDDKGNWMLWLLRTPLVLYAQLYMRVTYAIARRQELAADAIAARLVGAEAVARGLRMLPMLDSGWAAFTQTEIAGPLAMGRRPPIASGFRAMLRVERLAQVVARSEKKFAQGSRSIAFDSHPPITERLAALGVSDTAAPEIPSPTPSLALLGDVPAHEAALLAFVLGSDEVLSFPPMAWDLVVDEVVIPKWHAVLAEFGRGLGRRPIELLPTGTQELVVLGIALLAAAQRSDINKKEVAVTTLAASIGETLRRRGGVVEAPIGSPITVRLGDRVIDPVDLVLGLVSHRLSIETWAHDCAAMGIAGVPLAQSPPAPAGTRPSVRPPPPPATEPGSGAPR